MPRTVKEARYQRTVNKRGKVAYHQYDAGSVKADSTAASIRRGKCNHCGRPLPCISCAKTMRKKLGLVGKEPRPSQLEGYLETYDVNGKQKSRITYELALAPDVEEAARKIREEGFEYVEGERVTKYPPWTERDYLVRSGQDPNNHVDIRSFPCILRNGHRETNHAEQANS